MMGFGMGGGPQTSQAPPEKEEVDLLGVDNSKQETVPAGPTDLLSALGVETSAPAQPDLFSQLPAYPGQENTQSSLPAFPSGSSGMTTGLTASAPFDLDPMSSQQPQGNFMQ